MARQATAVTVAVAATVARPPTEMEAMGGPAVLSLATEGMVAWVVLEAPVVMAERVV